MYHFSYTAELRYTLLGITGLDQILFIVFTIRNNIIRIISARKADKKERQIYEEEAKKNPQI
ncbi:MAG: BrnT family toxin [Candidatus Doudnabacteria bacterium]|nr:BrnT family toxin [Candidatus Doudnabacteria bacterium]